MGMMERIIKAGYRDLAKKYHPDTGGDDEQMKELNASYDALNGALQGKTRR
jgi:molecular chaperone DnaJ